MLTTNRSFGMDFYRRSGQTMSCVLRNHAIGDGYESPTYSSNRDTPVPDSDGKTTGTPRKRVPVACERCRKRKIKCSGDQGDGSGCENCKTAGHDGCQFLRVLSRPVQQFSQSYNTPRYRTQHYHPYSRPSHAHHVQHAHHTRDCVQQTTPSFESWPTSIEYNDLSTAASASMNWNPTAYTASYPMYDTEHTSPYAAQPPSYMLPDPGHGVRSEVSYVGNFPRTHPHQLWLDSIDNVPIQHQHAQLISPIYPITPAESIKSQSLLTQPAMMNIDCERALPTPSLTTLQPILPSQGRETPPLSAASHRSSHTWTTDSVSNISAVSSRTSCGGSQDLPAMMHPYTACEDQPTTYPYQVDGSRPLLDNAVASLPITEDKESHPSKFQQVSQHPDSHNRELASLRARVSRDSLKSSSPSVYGQPIRSSTRRSHAMYPPRLMTSFHDGSCPSIWMPSPSTASPRHDSATSQAAVHPLSGSSDEYSDDQTHL